MNPLEALETLDLRVGRILKAESNPRARRPSYKLWIDFGPLGEKTSSAQLTARFARFPDCSEIEPAVIVNIDSRDAPSVMPLQIEQRDALESCAADVLPQAQTG